MQLETLQTHRQEKILAPFRQRSADGLKTAIKKRGVDAISGAVAGGRVGQRYPRHSLGRRGPQFSHPAERRTEIHSPVAHEAVEILNVAVSLHASAQGLGTCAFARRLYRCNRRMEMLPPLAVIQAIDLDGVAAPNGLDSCAFFRRKH